MKGVNKAVGSSPEVLDALASQLDAILHQLHRVVSGGTYDLFARNGNTAVNPSILEVEAGRNL